MTMERLINSIPPSNSAGPIQMDLPIVLDVTFGKNRFVLGLFQDRSTAREAIHHLRTGVFLDGRGIKQLETRRLAILKDIDFGTVLRKMLGMQPAAQVRT